MIPRPEKVKLTLDETHLFIGGTYQQMQVLKTLIADADLLPTVPESGIASALGFGNHILPRIGPYPPIVPLRNSLRSDEILRTIDIVAHIKTCTVRLVDIAHEFFPVKVVDKSRKVLVTTKYLFFVQIRFLCSLQVILARNKQRDDKKQRNYLFMILLR